MIGLVSFKQAEILKNLGFDEKCIAKYYRDSVYDYNYKFKFMTKPRTYIKVHKFVIYVPTYAQAFKWFRDNYECEFHIECYRHTSVKYYQVHLFDGIITSMTFGKSLTYEEAESACLDKLIELTKTKT